MSFSEVAGALRELPAHGVLLTRGMQIRFDRGTILLDPAASGVDPEQLPGVAWDPRVDEWRAPADAYAAIVGRLADERVRVSDEIPDSRTDAADWSLPDLRWYQQHALTAWLRARRRGVVSLPTGAGKTLVAVAAIAACQLATLVLVPTRVLLEQWATVLGAYMPAIGKLGDGHRRVAPITVSTYASAVQWGPRIGGQFGLVIVDEAHHVGAMCPADLFEMFVASSRLGLTATPPPSEERAPLERHVGPVIYQLGVDDLVGDALARYDIFDVPIELTAAEREDYDAARRVFRRGYAAFRHAYPGATWNGFVEVSSRTDEGRAHLAAWRTSRAITAFPADKRRVLRELLDRHRGSRVLVFTSDTRTAYVIAEDLLVHPITHEVTRSERAAILGKFSRGEASVLVAAQVLDEGIDVPEADVAIIVGGTASARRYIQRIGRVLRPLPGKRARVYELVVADTTEVQQGRRRRGGLTGVGVWS